MNPRKVFTGRLAHLKSLRTSQQIRDFLGARGVKGEKLEAGSCPIANYLNPDDHEYFVSVVGGYAALHGGEGDFITQSHWTVAMEHFIRMFDGNRYPELDVNSENEH